MSTFYKKPLSKTMLHLEGDFCIAQESCCSRVIYDLMSFLIDLTCDKVLSMSYL